jgi:phage terminase large subunit-like protein
VSPSAKALELVRSLSDAEWNYLASRLITVHFPSARPEQVAPDGDWSVWMIMAGRGWGKTRTGSEWLVEEALNQRGDYFVCAPTFRDMRAVCVEGARSGLLAVLNRRAVEYDWNISTTLITLSNGSKMQCGSADEPDRWRGYNFAGGWGDEVASWRRPDTFTQLSMATRMGIRPRMVVTTTPKPTVLVKDLASRPSVHITRGRTWDNAANLSEAALEELRHTYEGTRLGRQELEGELLLDTPGALWTDVMIGDARVEVPPDMDRIVVAIDPAVTSGEESDLTGIVVVGKCRDQFYVLEDSSGRHTPDGWARVAVGLADKYQADRVVAEVNNGGDLVERVMREVDRDIAYRAVRASRGKRVRAEPVAALYEQGRVHHVGYFPDLEAQLCDWTPDSPVSPDRMDALVWAVTDLMASKGHARIVVRH